MDRIEIDLLPPERDPADIRSADERPTEAPHQPRSCLVHNPKGTAPATGRPLLLAFHGGGIDAQRMADFCGLTETADQHGFLVAFPNGTGRVDHARSWNAGRCCGHAWKYGIDEIAFVRALLTRLRDEFGCDPTRTYAAGVSNGGMLSYRLAAELPHEFAAVCSVAGQMVLDHPPTTSPVSVLHFHGTADEFTPHLGGRGPRSPSQTTFQPVSETIAAWVRATGCSPIPQEDQWVDPSGLPIRKFAYREPGLPTHRAPREVIYYEIEGGGHTWPGRQPTLDFLGRSPTGLLANDILWEFCTRHRSTH
jgi:polyhydroxybutyrate depolymerase